MLRAFLDEICQVRTDVLNSIKEAVRDTSCDVNSGTAADFDRAWAMVGLAGSFIAIVGTVTAAAPAGCVVAGIATLSSDAWTVGGAGINVAGSMVNLIGGFQQNLNKPTDVRQALIDAMKQQILNAIDSAHDRTANHPDQLAPLRNTLYKKYRFDNEYGPAFALGVDTDATRTAKRKELIWTTQVRTVSKGNVINNQTTAIVKQRATETLIDLFDVTVRVILPGYQQTLVTTVRDGFIRDSIPKNKTVIMPMSIDGFVSYLHNSQDYKSWAIRHRVPSQWLI
jgi:hypothetical protein